MNNETLQRFLKGTASETEQRTCEALLSGNTPIVDDTVIDNDDPIIAALQQPKDSGSMVSSEWAVPRGISQMFPDISERSKRIREVLETSNHPEDLGAIGRYRIVELIGVGSSSWVFRAIDTSMDREVCIKLLQPDKGTSIEVRSRFAREAREVARMSSDRIMPVLELGHLSQTPYLVMPFLEGRSLRTLIEQEQPLTPDRAQRFVKQIAEGLSHAHSLGVMHRDIKPENIWVTPSDDIKLLDFGLAHIRDESTPITREGTVVGTPSYMSPEQVTGKPVDARSDLFSLGVVLVELLTGQSPFNKNNLFSTLMSVAGDPIDFAAIDPDQSISVPLRHLIVDLLHKAPDERIPSADLLIERLENLNSKVSTRAPEAMGGGRIFKTMAAGLAGFALCAALLWMWDFSDRGTLVVETSDPAVQVAIANEKVTVVDPVSKQSYEIKIGETKLPSGYYQLEAKLADGLAFSSDSITIRRGEKILVSVSLKPPVDTAKAVGNPAIDPTAKQPDSKVAMEADSGLNKPWADPTRDPLAHNPATRQQVFDRLAKLPSLPVEHAGNTAKNTLGPVAHDPSTQETLPGIQDWWVEPSTTVRTATSNPNCDQSLWLDRLPGWIKIADRTGVRQLHIPTAGIVRAGYRMPDDDYYSTNTQAVAFWDPVHPQLLTICSINPEVPFEADRNHFQIQVWLLSLQDDSIQGRVIRQFTADSPWSMLDSGYRLFLVSDRKLMCHRLDNELSWQVATVDPGDKSNLSFAVRYQGPHSISPDGRRLAATVSTSGDISIFNLQSGKFELALDAQRAMLGNTDRAVAVDVENLRVNSNSQQGATPIATRKSIQVWDIPKQIMEKEFNIDPVLASRNTRVVVNGSMTFAAFVAYQGIRIIDLNFGLNIDWKPKWATIVQEPLVDHEFVPNGITPKEGSLLMLSWRDDQHLEVFHRGEVATWNPGGKFEQTAKVLIADHRPQVGRMEIHDVKLHDQQSLSVVWQAGFGYQDHVAGVKLDLQDATIAKAYQLDVDLSIDSRSRSHFYKWLSPDGQFLAVRGDKAVQVRDRGGRQNVQTLFDLTSPTTTIATIQSNQAAVWSSNSNYAIFGNQLFDAESRRIEPIRRNSGNFVPLSEKSLLTLQQNRLFHSLFSSIDESKDITNLLPKPDDSTTLQRIDLVSANVRDPLFLLQYTRNRSRDSDNRSRESIMILVRIHEDLTVENLGRGKFYRGETPLGTRIDSLSSDTSHLLRPPGAPGFSEGSTTSNWHICKIKSVEEGQLEIESVCEAERVQDFQWHDANPSASWTHQVDRDLRFFDHTTGVIHESKIRSEVVISFGNGWLVAIDDWLLAVDRTGKPTGRLVFHWEGGQPKFAHWILPNNTVQSGVPLKGLFISSVEDNTVRTTPLDQVIEREPFKKVLSDQPMNFLK